VSHASGHYLEASSFKTGVNLADHVLGNCVGLDDGESTFDGHGVFPEWMLLKFFCPADKTLDSNRAAQID
jgi:hypothetical protein